MNFPFKVLSALAMASSREIEGVVDGTFARKINIVLVPCVVGKYEKAYWV